MTETPQAPPSAPPPPPPSQGHQDPQDGWHSENLRDYRQLRRSRVDRKVAGVAGGLGRHLNIDPTILRVLFVVLVFFGAAGLLLYAVLWLLVPEEDTGRTVVGTSDSTRNALLIAAGVVAVLIALGDSWGGSSGLPWLVLGGLVVLAVLMGRDKRPAGPTPPPPSPGTGAPAVAPRPVDPRRTGPLLFGTTVALVALVLGVMGLVDVSGGAVSDPTYAAVALGLVGLMLVVGAFYGRAGGLILLGLVAALALAGSDAARPTYQGDRDLVLRPTSAAAVQESYRVPAGRIELDLTGVRDLDELDGRSIELDANVGEIVVVVPRGVDVTYDADIAFGGAIDTPGTTREGWGSHLRGELGGASAADVPEVDVRLDLQFGHIEVKQS